MTDRVVAAALVEVVVMVPRYEWLWSRIVGGGGFGGGRDGGAYRRVRRR